ncbi:Adenine deaminase [Vibrio stylophorae]|uniref:Adenine deaminase n=1 Tax=Vibrio stylophorae TaxID=659351 RepID=A0ABM8ZTT0_9VIBR|nr:hypothetical protein [Vibrio stylophorae]CAH0533717.1 Adenine deaminase [Vibrio stylophorae]
MENWLAALPKLELDVKLEDTRLGGRDVLLDGIESMSDPQVLNRQLMRDADYYQLAHNWLLRCHAEGVVHVEPSIMPFAHSTLSFAAIMEALTDAFESAEANWGMTWRLSVAMHPEQVTDTQIRAAMAMAQMHPWLGSITLALTEHTQYSDFCKVITALSAAPIPLRCAIDSQPSIWQVNERDRCWQLIRSDQGLSDALAPLQIESQWVGMSSAQIVQADSFDDFLFMGRGQAYLYSRSPDKQGSVTQQLRDATEKYRLSAYQIKQLACNAIAASMMTDEEKGKWQEVVLNDAWEFLGES